MKNEQARKDTSESSLLVAFATGLLPFVAVCGTAYDGVTIGVIILLTLIISSSIYSLFKRFFKNSARLATYIIITSGVVSIISLFVQAFFKSTYDTLGIYLPIMAVSVSVIGIGGGSVRSENFVYTLQNATFEGAAAILVLFSVGSIREILGFGRWLLIPLPEFLPKIAIFKQPAGGFLVYGITLAVLSISLNAFAEKQSLLNLLEETKEEKRYDENE